LINDEAFNPKGKVNEIEMFRFILKQNKLKI